MEEDIEAVKTTGMIVDGYKKSRLEARTAKTETIADVGNRIRRTQLTAERIEATTLTTCVFSLK